MRHASVANLEGVSTDEGLTLSHIRKTSVTGLTRANSKKQEKTEAKHLISRPQTAKYFTRPNSEDPDSLDKQ